MMEDLNILSILMSVIGGLVIMLTAVIGWIGSRIHGRLDSIATSLNSIERPVTWT